MRKKTLIAVGSAALVLVVGAVVVLGYFFGWNPNNGNPPDEDMDGGASTSGNTDDTAGADTNGIIDTVEEAQTVLVPSVSRTFTNTTIQNEEIPSFLGKLESLQTFTVLSVTAGEEGSVITTLTVSAPDLAWVMEHVSTMDNASEAEMDVALVNALSQAPLRTENVTVAFYELDGQWYPSVTDQFFNACYGGILEVREDLLGGENDA